MKYTIEGYSQKEALSLGLDITDLLILRWIQDFYPNMTKKIINEKEYAWINYKYFLEDMPLLGIKTKDGLYRRLKKIESVGLLEKCCERNKTGVYSYIRITGDITKLTSSTPIRMKIRNHTDENPYTHTDENPDHNNKSTIIDPSTKDTNGNLLEKLCSTNYITAEFKTIVQVWLDYKKAEKRQSYKTERSLKAFIDMLNEYSQNDNKKAETVIKNAMANNYMGIVPLKNQSKPKESLEELRNDGYNF